MALLLKLGQKCLELWFDEIIIGTQNMKITLELQSRHTEKIKGIESLPQTQIF